MPTKWGRAIIELREERGMTQVELASKAEMLQSHLSKIERGSIQNPRPSYLKLIAKALGVSLQELAGRARLNSSRSQETNRIAAEVLERVKASALRVPIIGEAHAGREGILGPIEDYAYWSRPRAADRNIIGIICRGFCLEPEVREGDIIFIDQDLSADPGDIVLVTVGDEIRLVPWNHGRHDLRADAVIQGVVIEVSRRLK